MEEFEMMVKPENLDKAKANLVPHIFSQNYFNILKLKLQDKKLSTNQRYYYNHFVKKKLRGMVELLEVNQDSNGEEFMKATRLKKADEVLKRFARKHRKMKVLISGSFLYKQDYNDIDVFVLSKYGKEDYREGKVHVNYLPDDVEGKLFFQSLASISLANFKFSKHVKEEFSIEDVLHLYEVVALLMMQKDDYKQELRDLVLRLEYVSNGVVLNPMQLEKALKDINSVDVLNAYLTGKLATLDAVQLRKALRKFIRKNKGDMKNLKLYNDTYLVVLKLANRRRKRSDKRSDRRRKV